MPFNHLLVVKGAIAAAIFCSFGKCVPAQESARADRPVFRVVYFVPADCQPEPDHLQRLDRVMHEIERFYRDGMKQNGFGSMSFKTDRNADASLRVFTVEGREPMRGYGRNDVEKSRAKIRQEVKEALAKEGLDFERETAVVFQVALERLGDRAVEIGPFSGAGDAQHGSALVFDDPRLDPRWLTSNQPGGYHLLQSPEDQPKPCTLGEFNSQLLGGIIHEVGHAFGLPHEREFPLDQLRKGWSIMGSGHRKYGQELRGEGRGAFLTAAAAFPLSLHPHFVGKPSDTTKMTCELSELKAIAGKQKLTLIGRLQGKPNAAGVVVYNNPDDKPDAYDAFGRVCRVDADGSFRVVLEELQPTSYELLFRAYGSGGEWKEFRYHFQVGPDGRPDIGPLNVSPLWLEALAAFKAKDQTELAEIVARVKKLTPKNELLARKVAHLQQLLSPENGIPKFEASLPPTARAAQLAELEWDEAEVGWNSPLRNRVPSEKDSSGLIEVNGAFFESGLFAHAPARHAWRLTRKWKTVTVGFGLQDGHDGSVNFVVKGDGRELFRSPVVRDHQVRQQIVNISGVTQLELIVENAGDGGRSDWGVWLAPELRR